MPKVRFSNLLASKLNLGRGEMLFPANNLNELFQMLEEQINGFKDIIITESGEMNQFLAVCLNDELVNRDETNVQLKDDDHITIINMIAGG